MNEDYLAVKSDATKIIKRKNQKTASMDFSSLIKHQIVNAHENARIIVQKAQKNADELIAETKTSAENIRARAYREGREQAESELIENILAIRAERERVLTTVEQDVLKLAVKLAEKIIGRELEQDENARGEIVINALRSARREEMLTVRVGSEDLAVLEEMREKIDRFGRARYIDFVADQSVKKGGCIIESASGTIDARLETQLRILENALLARVSNEK